MGRRLRGRASTAGIAAAAALALACGRRSAEAELHSASPQRRAAAVAALADARSGSDLAVLLVAGRDPSPLVRKAAAGAFTAQGGPRAVEALGALLLDDDPEVAVAAARGLGAMPRERRARELLVDAYARAPPEARAEIATSLHATGVSLREAVEAEARRLWDRNAAALDRGAPAERAGAAEELGRSGRTEAVQKLLPLLDVERRRDVPLAVAAARGLGNARDPSARPLLEELLDEDDARLGEAAAEALGDLGDPRASAALARAGARGPARTAAAAVEALSRLPQASEVGVALCEVALRAVDPRVTAAAARHAHSREAECPDRPLIARLARGGPDAAAALAALGALGLTGNRLQVPAQRALALLRSGDQAVETMAATTLAELGYSAAAPALAKRARALVQKLADARRERSPPRASAPGAQLQAPVEDAARADAEELASVVVALARLRADGALALADGLATDASDTVRAAAAEAMRHLGGDDARSRLSRALDDPSPRVQLAAVASLGQLGAAAVPALSAATQARAATNRDLGVALARALGDTGSPDAIPALSGLLEHAAAPDAATALGRIGAKEGCRPLLELLDRPGGRGRLEAVDALGQIGVADAGPALAAELTSDRPEVRAAAARALGRIRHASASPELEALRSDYYGSVRRAAVEALAKLPARPGQR